MESGEPGDAPKVPAVVPVPITAKLSPQRMPRGAIRRPALVEILGHGSGASLTLICAPAGFGKTTLLTEWVETGRILAPATPFAWVTLDSRDSEPVRFWRHVIAALAGAAPGVGERSLEAMRAGAERIVDAALPLLLDDLGRVETPIVLILDDYYRAETLEIDTAVEQLLSYRPDCLHVVMATRSDPALGIPRLRASGRLVELRADALAFSDHEASRFLAGMGVTDLTGADEQSLLRRAGGWPALLRIAALLLPAAGRHEFIESFSGGQRQVVDYLTGDVLDLLPPDRREFLLQVSILRRMTGSLCDAVAATSGSGSVLADLERSGLFISVDAAGAWYESHQLFHEALQVELARTRFDLVPVLHARAAAWYEQFGDLELATDHAIAARDVSHAGRLLAAQAQPMAARGRGDRIRRWIAELSWPEAQLDPELAYARAVDAAVHNDLDGAGHWLDIAATGPADQLDSQGLPLSFRVDYLRAVTSVNDVHRAEEAGRRAAGSAPSARWEGMAWSGVGQALYLQDRFGEARVCLRRAVALTPETNPLLLSVARANLVLVEAASATEPLSEGVLEGALELLRRTGADNTPSAALIEMAWGEVRRTRGELHEAVVHFDASLEILGAGTPSCVHANAYLLLSQVQHALGDSALALRSLDAADSILSRQRDPGALPDRARRLRRTVSTPLRRAAGYGEVLTERESAVLNLLVEGRSQREIAMSLFISHTTVKTHLKSVYRKLGVTSRDGAVERLRSGGSAAGADLTRVRFPEG